MKISKRDVFIFILAGGKGTRFWPLSRESAPKQFLRIFGNKSMLQMTYRRLSNFIPSKQIYIITTNDQVNAIRSDLPHMNVKNFIIEPLARGTAAAIGLAAVAIKKKNPHGIMVVIPADQYVDDTRKLKGVLYCAIDAAARARSLVTVGIKPTYAATGYGYLKFKKRIRLSSGSAYHIEKFIEKPSLKKARSFVTKKDYYFNSGMFIFKCDVFLEELKKHMPRLYRVLDKIARYPDFYYSANTRSIYPLYKILNPISIDYGLMQKSHNILGVKATFKWSDLGNFKSLEEIMPQEEDSNIVIGAQHVKEATKGCIVYGSKGHLVATIGIEDIMIIQCPEVTLVAHKKDAQKIRDLVNRIARDRRLRKFT